MENLNSENRIDRTCLGRQDEDRISNLPDSVLQHILAFVSTKNAVRTSTLSRRWRNLWKLVPCLDLNTYDISDKNEFLNFMHKFVDLRGNSYMQKFQLLYHRSSELETYYRLNSWIDVIVMCKLEYLELFIDLFGVGRDNRVKMPQSLFLCNTLVVLKLTCVVVDVPENISLSCLKIMHLDAVVYADDSAFRTLISGCPILEEVTVVRSEKDNVQVMCVCSRTLKLFTTVCELDAPGSVNEIIIDAPHLEYLSINDHVSEFLVMNGLDSCLEAKIDVTFNMDYEDAEFEDDSLSKLSSISMFLFVFSNVKSLSFTSFTLELLSKYLKFDSLPRFHGVIHLQTNFGDNEWEALPALLVCCPNLKSFVLECWNRLDEPPIPLLSEPKCLLSLESITVQTFFTENKVKMGIVRYFLENAVVLKKMTIRLARSISNESVIDILKELLTLPRSSPACRIVID